MLICFIIFQMVDFKLHFLEGAYDSKALSLVSYISPQVGELIFIVYAVELIYYSYCFSVAFLPVNFEFLSKILEKTGILLVPEALPSLYHCLYELII